MGAFLDKPSTIKKNEKGGNNSYHYAVSMMQGWRLNMEDSHTAKLELPGLPNWSFFAVFDGHAGASVAEYSAENLVNSILSHANFQKYIADTDKEICDADVCSAIKESFLSIDVAMRDLPDFKNGVDRSGSTAVCVLVSPTKFYFANCGDSRAFLCRDSKVNFSTKDHKPVDPEEKERIENAGGSVMVRRINGTLAVSRALGDFEYKTDKNKEPTKQLVSPEPEVTTLNRDEGDHFIVLACDGIFDVSSTEEVAEFVSSRMQISDDMVNVCNSVVDTSFNKGSRDNMTMILLSFPAAPKVDQGAIKKEREMEEKLKVIVKGICEDVENEPLDINSVMQLLGNRENEIENLPPGGSVYAKRSVIEECFKEFYVAKPTPEET